MLTISPDQVIIEGKLYQLTDFIPNHPGGERMIRLMGGTDATYVYRSYHRHSKYRTKLKYIKDVDSNLTYRFTKEFEELRNRVYAALPNPYANHWFYLKCLVLLGSALFVETYSWWYGKTVVNSIALGLLFAWIGLNIQHDGNHGAVSKNKHINRLLGYTDDWIGGSSLLWLHHHVRLHHAETNHFRHDPDCFQEAVRLHRETKWKPSHLFQTIYFWIALSLLPLSWHFCELYDLSTTHHAHYPISPLLQKEITIGRVMKILFLIRYYGLPLLLAPCFSTVQYLLISNAVAGTYLGIFFAVSHNFDGVVSYNSDQKEMDWAKAQIESSSNVGFQWLGVLNGGLNYQIEHHLFPKICHVHYPTIAPIVRKWCSEHQYNYTHFPTILHNLWSTQRYLWKLGQPKIQKKVA